MDAPVADGQEPQITQTNCLFVFCRNKCNPFLLDKNKELKSKVSQYKHVAYISYPSIHRKKERKEISISFSQQEHCTFIFSFSPSCNRVLQTYKPPFPLPRLPMKGGASPCRRSQQNKTVQCQAQILFPVEFKRKETTGKNIRKSGNTGKKKGTWKTFSILNKKNEFQKSFDHIKKPTMAMGIIIFFMGNNQDVFRLVLLPDLAGRFPVFSLFFRAFVLFTPSPILFFT